MSAVEKAKTEFLEFSEIVRVFVSRPNLFKLFMDSAWNLINANEQAVNSRLAAMTQERDDIQLRLHAIDHAYNEQQRSENKLILEQQETIRRQRKFIKTLYTSRKARKGKGSTSAQSERENVPKAKSGGNAVVSEGNLKRADVVRQEEGLRSGQVGCNGQAAVLCNHRWQDFGRGCIVCAYCGARGWRS